MLRSRRTAPRRPFDVTNGETLITDGPAAEIKEHLGGYVLLEWVSIVRRVAELGADGRAHRVGEVPMTRSAGPPIDRGLWATCDLPV